ncbi:MAG: hypothetical protein WBB01_06445 [Phormidesmis sp.]
MESRSSLLWQISEEWSSISGRPHIGFDSVPEMQATVNPPEHLLKSKGLEKLTRTLEWLRSGRKELTSKD